MKAREIGFIVSIGLVVLSFTSAYLGSTTELIGLMFWFTLFSIVTGIGGIIMFVNHCMNR